MIQINEAVSGDLFRHKPTGILIECLGTYLHGGHAHDGRARLIDKDQIARVEQYTYLGHRASMGPLEATVKSAPLKATAQPKQL